MFELTAVSFVEIWEVRFMFKMPSSWTKRLELSLEIKSNEYISVFSLIFQFPLHVLCSYKALINSTCNSGLYKVYKHSYFLFFELITYLFSYQNICIFLKWKHVKYHAERPKHPFHPGVETFRFQPKVKGTCISKKSLPWVEISPRGEFHLSYV